VRVAAKSGDTSDLEDFIKETADRGKGELGGFGGGLGQYFNLIPGGSEIILKFQQLKGVTEKHWEEAERLAKEAFKEIQEVLRWKVEEAQKWAEKATKQ
jgi:hypothetical protein